ncbi:MAG TPA: hypothetical protein ENH65_12390 [Candidatus Aminicenantes bacterium]|nr:hypothetical protein [Candidatus Aminicenantes bacterium]
MDREIEDAKRYSNDFETETEQKIKLDPVHLSRITRSPSIAKIAEALSKAQGEMENAKKDKTNPFFKSKYADLTGIWNACRPILTKHGLAVVQAPSTNLNDVIITTILCHNSGEFFESELTLHSEKSTPQSMGSAATYGRRYSLSAMIGIAADEDDDGNVASKQYKTIQEPTAIQKEKAIEKPKEVENAPKGIKTVTTEIKIEGGQAKKQDEKVTETDGNGKPPTTDPEKRKRGRPAKDTGTETAEKELPAQDSEAIKKEILKLDGQCASGLKIMKDNRFLTDQKVLEYEREINDYVKKGDVESLRGVYKDLKGLYFDTSKANQK